MMGTTRVASRPGTVAARVLPAAMLALAGLWACAPEQAAAPAPAAGESPALETGPAAAQAESMAAPPAPAAAPKPGTAILVSGNERGSGLPFYPDNALPYLYAEYRATSVAGAGATISAWYVKGPPPPPAGWTAPNCPASGRPAPRGSLASAPADGSVSWYIPAAGYALFVSAPETYADICSFAAALAERFAFFLRYAPDEAALSFPAVLEPAR